MGSNKHGTNELIYKTETNSQILKPNLWLSKGKCGVGSDKLGNWYWHTHLLLFSRPAVSDSLRPMDCSRPGLPAPPCLPEFTQIRVYCISDAIQPSHPLTASSPSALELSQHQDFSNELSVHIIWPKCWSFSFSISSSSKYSGLISFRINWIDLLAVQETLGSHITLGREGKE